MVQNDPDNVMRRTRADNASYVIDQMHALELFPDPTSRIMQMHQTLSQGYIPFNDPKFPIALEAERDMQLLGFIFDQMHVQGDNPEFRTLVKRLLKDSVLPQKDRENSPGRDTQFELYLAAICQSAALLPVNCAEPDVTCTIRGTKFGIAAKRLKSFTSLEKHIRKAAKQIAKTGIPGVIALDISLARNQQNLPIISKLQSQLYVPIAQLADRQFFDEHHQNIYRWVDSKRVIAVVVFDFRIRLRKDQTWGLEGMTCWLSTANNDSQANRHYKTFYSGFLKGIPNLTELTT